MYWLSIRKNKDQIEKMAFQFKDDNADNKETNIQLSE